MFDGTIKRFAIKLCTALQKQAEIRRKDYPVVALVLLDMSAVIREVAELDAKTTGT